MAKYKKGDLNRDGVVDEADKDLEQFDDNKNQRLNTKEWIEYRKSLLPEQTRVLSSLTLEAIETDSGLYTILKEWATDPTNPDTNDLLDRIENSDFAKEYATDSARIAWNLEFNTTPEEWEQEMKGARAAVQAEATRLGIQLTDQQLEGMARAWKYEGWQFNEDAMRQALLKGVDKSPWVEAAIGAGTMDYTAGLLGDTVADLRNTAYMNGIDYDDLWFQEAAQSVVGGSSTADDWKRDIREKAAGYFPAFAKQIEAGMDVRALASPYMQRMNRLWDMPMDSISLDDPTLMAAMSGQNEGGEFKAMNLADFDNMLRQDPRWDNSSNGKNTLLNGINSFLKSGGFKY